jgi:uncharacterized Ntn-hydrolase superfamily protein
VTYSLVAADPSSRLLGVAVASGSIAVGSRVPWGRAGVAVVATQAYTNPLLGKWVIGLISEGHSPRDAMAKALSKDSHPQLRQVAAVDVSGRVAIFAGEEIPEPHLEESGEGFACIGNLLKSQEVVREMCNAYVENIALPFPKRLLNALKAGHMLGGDARGDRSAAVLVLGRHPIYGYEYGKLVDLRVDLSSDPVSELLKIYSAISNE